MPRLFCSEVRWEEANMNKSKNKSKDKQETLNSKENRCFG